MKQNPIGYELNDAFTGPDARLVTRVCLWLGDFTLERVFDTQIARPAVNRCIARISETEYGHFQVTYTAAGKGGWRHTFVDTYDQALALVDRWAQRRFRKVAGLSAWDRQSTGVWRP